MPYEEELAEKLENEYLEGFRTGIWGRRMQLDAIGEVITFINPNAISHFCRAASADEWGNVPVSTENAFNYSFHLRVLINRSGKSVASKNRETRRGRH